MTSNNKGIESCCEKCVNAPKCKPSCVLRHFHCANCRCHQKCECGKYRAHLEHVCCKCCEEIHPFEKHEQHAHLSTCHLYQKSGSWQERIRLACYLRPDSQLEAQQITDSAITLIKETFSSELQALEEKVKWIKKENKLATKIRDPQNLKIANYAGLNEGIDRCLTLIRELKNKYNG